MGYDRLAQRIDELIYDLSLMNMELKGLRNRICYIENKDKLSDRK